MSSNFACVVGRSKKNVVEKNSTKSYSPDYSKENIFKKKILK